MLLLAIYYGFITAMFILESSANPSDFSFYVFAAMPVGTAFFLGEAAGLSVMQSTNFKNSSYTFCPVFAEI
jgi:hypothetical protein